MKYLFEFRKKKGLTQFELAELSGTTQNSIARYERGDVQPTVETAKNIAKALGITLDELINGSNDGQIKITLSYDWNRMKEVNIDMTDNSFELILGSNGEIGIRGAGMLTSREAINDFLTRIKTQLEIALDTQVRRGIIQEA